MSSEPMLLEPEVEALLREVAADPRSALLRVPRAKAMPTLYEDHRAAGPATAGLLAAEQEILRVHRFEVAWLLRQACVVKMLAGQRTRAFVGRYQTTRDRVGKFDSQELIARSRALETELDADGSSGANTHLLERALTVPHGDDPSILQLAAAAHRLHPSNESRLLGSQGLVLDESPRSALTLLRTVLESMPSRPIAARAWSTAGLAYAKLGRLDWALRGYQRGSALDETAPLFWMDRFVFSIQVGETSDAMHTSRHLEHMISPDHVEVSWFVESLIGRRRGGEWSPTGEALRLAPRLRDQVGVVARRMVDVFA